MVFSDNDDGDAEIEKWRRVPCNYLYILEEVLMGGKKRRASSKILQKKKKRKRENLCQERLLQDPLSFEISNFKYNLPVLF